MSIPDKVAAANKINELLKAVVAHGGLRLKYRITVDPPLPEERDWERPEILVEFAGPDSALLLERNASRSPGSRPACVSRPARSSTSRIKSR